MEAGPVIQTILMEVSAIVVLAGMVAFAVWVSRVENRTEQTQPTQDAVRF